MSGQSLTNFEPESVLVRQELAAVIELVDIAPQLKEGIWCQLTQQEKPLPYNKTERFHRFVLPLLVCEAIYGSSIHAVSGAAAVEFAAAAGDAFDDIQDHELDDSLVGIYGEEKALNVAIALLMLSQRAVVRLGDNGIKPDTIVSVMETICYNGLRSCSGQHRDLSLEDDISTDSYIEMIGLKTGSVVETACRVGAILATDDCEIIDSYGLFGWNLGIATQIIDDAQSIITTQWRKSDISKKKKTLPVIFASNYANQKQHQLMEYVYHPDTVITPDLQQEAAREIINSGGLYYCGIMAEKHKQIALKAINSQANTNSRLLALF